MGRKSGGAVYWVLFLLVAVILIYFGYPRILSGIDYIRGYVVGKNMAMLSDTLREAALINGVNGGIIQQANYTEELTDRWNLENYAIFYRNSLVDRGAFNGYVVYSRDVSLKAIRNLLPSAQAVDWRILKKRLEDYVEVDSKDNAFTPEATVVYYGFSFKVY